MLSLYPSAVAHPWAAKAGESIGLTGKGFAPGEHVLVHFNESSGVPPLVLQADASGKIPAGGGFRIPFGITGKQTVILTGEQSRASVSSGFSVLPYTPVVRASSWGGLPGTVLNFYVRDFAPNEVVKVYTGGTPGNAGELVAAFRVDAKGAASAVGSYTIPGNAQGKLTFNMVGSKSNSSGLPRSRWTSRRGRSTCHRSRSTSSRRTSAATDMRRAGTMANFVRPRKPRRWPPHVRPERPTRSAPWLTR
jgi:hypothetical protein